ncbi:MAG: HlyD family efflux transporter periplasmic adaptor subunit [Planctomycetaceae bacterium]
MFFLAVAMAGAFAANRSLPCAESDKSIPASPLSDFGVGALGRIEPQSEVIHVNAPSVMEPPVVEKMLVRLGDKVDAGQVLAILDSNRREQSDVELAKASVFLAEKSLAQIKAGAKAGDLRAQEELIARTRERLRLAEKQLERAHELRKSKALSEDDLDIRISDVEVLRRELAQYESALVALAEIRSVDVEKAEAEVARSKAALLRAEADLEISLIRSPLDGEILRIHARVGERIGSEGLLDMGDTRQMDVVAEVHESDILKIQTEQIATISMRNLETTLRGRVIEVGRLIGRKDVLSSDPVDDTDARVVEVRIRLDEEGGRRVSGLSWAKVEVTIDTSTPESLSTDMSDASTAVGRQGLPQ